MVASSDGGATFAAPVNASDVDPSIALYCPSIAVDAGDPNTVYVTYTADSGEATSTKALSKSGGHTVALAVSTDGGKTFTNRVLESIDCCYACADVTSPAPGVVTVAEGAPNGQSVPFFSYVDTAKGAHFADAYKKGGAPAGGGSITAESQSFATGYFAIESGGGSFGYEELRVFSDGNHHVCVTFRADNTGGKPNSVAIACSTDDGKTFAAAHDVQAEPMGTGYHHPVGVFGGGKITLAWWSEVAGKKNELHLAQSGDGGATFTKSIVPPYASKDAPLPLIPQYPAIAWSGGTLWMAYLASDGGPNRLAVDKSCDGGTTWSGAELVNGPEPNITINYQWPALLVGKDARMMVASQRHGSSKNDPYDLIRLVP